MSDTPFLIRPRTSSMMARVETCRSFSYRLNCEDHGGLKYEHMDFFCSQKAESSIEDAPEVSEALYQFCKNEVRRSVVEAKRMIRNPEEARRIA